MLSHEGTYPILYGSLPIPVGAAHRDGYLARPDEAGLFPVVLVLPGLDGMGSVEKDLCRRLARAGFAGLTIDLYGEPGDGLDLYNRLTDDQALAVIDELHQFVVSDDVEWNVEDGVGILATDVGGRFGLIKAATRDWVRSLALVSTPLTGDEDRLHRVAEYLDHLPIPVLGLYGAGDDLVDTATVDEAQRRNDHGQWLLYDEAGHGFIDIDGDAYDDAAANDAFARIIAFFSATLARPEIVRLG
ncbi:MAG TPA: dienelactone hydrolase family protein [Acidimicrobiia bacterium]